MDVPAGPDAVNLSIFEDTVEPCPCVLPPSHVKNQWPYALTAIVDCPFCKGTGYALTKRIYRATDRNLSALEALLKSKDALLEKAANTIDQAAGLFLKLGHQKESAQTKAAAQALRESAG